MEEVQFTISTDWKIRSWGSKMEALSKFSDRIIIGKSITDLFVENDLELLKAKLLQARLQEQSDYFRISFYTMAAERLDMLLYAFLQQTVLDEQFVIAGGCIRAPGVSCGESMAVGIDSDGCVTAWGEDAEATTGFGLRWMRSRSLIRYFMTENFGAKGFAIRKMKQVLRGESSAPFIMPIFTTEGELKIIKLSLFSNAPSKDVNASARHGCIAECSNEDPNKYHECNFPRSSDTLATICPATDADLPDIATAAPTEADLPDITTVETLTEGQGK
eukprot:TRINITY_DN4539_c0_g1_i3.p1 TRINITY_DN4539_c0_g1~~TRINITY_DN4539_c0_g1_i3.p1  ORF type:complete len:275 (-),score=48.96 TRINITY_DN4539_c0_g1_i3:114-938(-)